MNEAFGLRLRSLGVYGLGVGLGVRGFGVSGFRGFRETAPISDCGSSLVFMCWVLLGGHSKTNPRNPLIQEYS